MNIKGVITGDVINSSSIPIEQRSDLLTFMSSILDDIKQVFSLHYEFFRGDSIQIIIENPSDALLVGLLFRAGLRGRTGKEFSNIWDARISIGIGKTEYLANHISTSDGEAFRLSGRTLDNMNKATLCLTTPWVEVNDEFKVSLPFVDDIVCGWTVSQACALYHTFLKQSTKKEVATILGQSPQNISRLLILAKEKPIRNLIDRFKTVITSKIQ